MWGSGLTRTPWLTSPKCTLALCAPQSNLHDPNTQFQPHNFPVNRGLFASYNFRSKNSPFLPFFIVFFFFFSCACVLYMSSSIYVLSFHPLTLVRGCLFFFLFSESTTASLRLSKRKFFEAYLSCRCKNKKTRDSIFVGQRDEKGSKKKYI